MDRPQPLAGCRVLVVEDEYFIADHLSRLFSEYGAEVVGPLGTLEDALAEVRKDAIEVAVLDLNLRDQMAFPIADQLQKQNIPFVLATGYGGDSVPERFRHVSHWQKPFDDKKLLEDVSRLVGGNRAQ